MKLVVREKPLYEASGVVASEKGGVAVEHECTGTGARNVWLSD